MTTFQKLMAVLIAMEVAFIFASYLALTLLGLGPVFAFAIGSLVAVALPVAVHGDVVGLLSLGRRSI